MFTDEEILEMVVQEMTLSSRSDTPSPPPRAVNTQTGTQ
jgi:hypothetical protein